MSDLVEVEQESPETFEPARPVMYYIPEGAREDHAVLLGGADPFDELRANLGGGGGDAYMKLWLGRHTALPVKMSEEVVTFFPTDQLATILFPATRARMDSALATENSLRATLARYDTFPISLVRERGSTEVFAEMHAAGRKTPNGWRLESQASVPVMSDDVRRLLELAQEYGGKRPISWLVIAAGSGVVDLAERRARRERNYS